jgi:preprotein translocase subunit SecG
MEIFLLAIHVIAAASILVLVLLQHGKGADMGAAFGTGSAGSVFGAAGSANFLSRATGIAATIFFATSIGLTYVGAHRTSSTGGVMQGVTGDPGKNEQSVPGSAPVSAPTPAKSDIPK